MSLEDKFEKLKHHMFEELDKILAIFIEDVEQTIITSLHDFKE